MAESSLRFDYTIAVEFTASEVARIVGGELVGTDVDIEGVSIDSRLVTTGNLFVPIVAERDGHEFIPMAFSAGASAHFWSRSAKGSGFDASIVVDDNAAALTALGAAARDRLPSPVIGVTGSVGKTSAKDLIAAACSSVRRTHANPASFNNELGLPLTLVNAPNDTEVTIVEMGARGPGHVADLCAVARPTIGLVTRVAGAHTELFGSLEGVAQAKGELIEALPSDGVAVLNADDHRVVAMARRSNAEVVTYGVSGDVRLGAVELDELLRPTFTVATPQGEAQIALPLAGEHMAHNATGALAVALAAGIPLADAVRGLESTLLSDWRMDVSQTPSGALVINDAYNANPTSVRAALASLDALAAERKTVVLGVMAELGDEHEAEHLAIAHEAITSGVRVIAVDAADYGAAVEHVESIDAALAALGEIDGRDAILVKGSRVAALERLANRLSS